MRRRNAAYSKIACPDCGRLMPLDAAGRPASVCPVCDVRVVEQDTPEEIAEREAGYGRALAGRYFPPGTSPSQPPLDTTGISGGQRWLEGQSYEARASGLIVPTSQPDAPTHQGAVVFDKKQFTVENIPRSNVTAWNAALQFIVDNHYARGLPNVKPDDTIVHGLYHNRDGLMGVALYISEPVQRLAIDNVFPGGKQEALELSRFILRPEVQKHGESWFLDESRRLLRKAGLRGFVSFSDPHARITEDDEIIKPGHYGGIYQATGLAYLGQGKDETFWFRPDWSVVYPRGITKIRVGESGWENQVRKWVDWGARPPRCLRTGHPDVEELRAWVERWLPRLARRLRVPGKHKFAFFTHPDKERGERRRLATMDEKIVTGPGRRRVSMWSTSPVVVPFREGRPGVEGIKALGHPYPKKPDEPEVGRVVENPWERLNY